MPRCAAPLGLSPESDPGGSVTMNDGRHDAVRAFRDSPLGQEYFRAYDEVLSHWPTAPDRNDIATSFGATHVLSTGPADGPPLLLVHGVGSTGAFWHPLIATLAQRHRVHAVDVIGDPGRSVPGGDAVGGFDDLVAWSVQVLDALGATSADVCGHSLGGHLALRLALDHPRRVRRLVLLDPARCFAEVRLSFLLRMARRSRRTGYDQLRADLARTIRADGPAAEAYLDLVARGTAHFPGLPPANPGRLRDSRLRRLNVPTLHVLAGDSELNHPRRAARAAARYSPVVTTEIIDGAGHDLIGEAPDRTANLIQDFLAEP